jgi:hypothetical protein
MRAVLKAQINKTDRNDARGIAQMIRVEFEARMAELAPKGRFHLLQGLGHVSLAG